MASKGLKIELLPENKMIRNVLLLKIVYTLVGIISYLTFPVTLIEYFGIGSNDSIMFIRSLGLAYIGLLFVYSSGYFQIIKKNKYPINVVLFGIFMNGGSVILILILGLIDGFNENIIRYAMLFLFFFIALMLIISLIKN
jgi:hypothetical protein